MFNHLKVKIYPSNKVHNLKWKNDVIHVNASVYDSYCYSLSILELKLEYQLNVKWPSHRYRCQTFALIQSM